MPMHAIWGHTVIACKLYKKLPNHFIMLNPYQQDLHEQYSFSASLPAFGVVTVFYFSHFDSYVVNMWLL